MATLNTALTPSPVVTVLNKDGSTASGYTGNITVELLTNPTNATLGGTTTVAASAGVATFSNLTLDRSGKDFTLRATGAASGGYTPRARVSRPFTIATQLTFTIQPTGTAAAGDIMEPFQVAAKDSAGNTDTDYEGDITVALYTGAGSGILSGFTTRLAVNGVADFSGLSIDDDGFYSLRATAETVTTAYTPAPRISNTFGIPGYILTAANLGSDTFGKAAGTGSITPTTYLGYTLRDLNVQRIDPSPDPVYYITTLRVTGSPTPSQSLFTSITINGLTFTSASATFSTVPTAEWVWETSNGAVTATGDYGVYFT